MRVRIAAQLGIGFLLVLSSAAVYAAKTDTVVLLNGNSVTGEVKSLEFGSLRYSTDSMGTVQIDWEDVVSVTSNQSLQIELADGTRYFGNLVMPDERFSVKIKSSDDEVAFPSHSIVRITPIETSERFLERLDGSFSFGAQTQKSSGVTTSNVAADVRYRTRQYLVGLRLNSSVTEQPNAPTSHRQSVEGNYQRFRPNRWFTDWFSSVERNDELGLERRVSLGGALGRYVVQNNKNQFSVTAGVQAARNTYFGEEPGDTLGEGRIELRYLHRNLTPESSITFTTKIYPELDALSRYRAESDLSWMREFIDDLFFEIKIGASYISDPVEGAASSDSVVTTSLGYSF